MSKLRRLSLALLVGALASPGCTSGDPQNNLDNDAGTTGDTAATEDTGAPACTAATAASDCIPSACETSPQCTDGTCSYQSITSCDDGSDGCCPAGCTFDGGDTDCPSSDADTWRFDNPWTETLDNAAPFDERKDFYGGEFSGNVHFDWTCLRHAMDVGRNGPDGAVEILLTAQPVPDHAIASENRQYNYRCELFKGPWHATGDGVGTEKWLGYSIYVPPDWLPDVVDEGVTQIHSGTAKPRMIFVMGGTSLDFYHRDSLTCGSDPDSNTKYHLLDVSPDNWYDIVVRVVAADSSDPSNGVLQVWAGPAGTLSQGNPTVDLSNLATVYDCSPQIGTLKLGIYKYTWHEEDNAGGAPVEPNAEASIANATDTRHYYYDNLSTYLGADGFGQVDPSRTIPADP